LRKLVDGLLGATHAMETRTKELETKLQNSSNEIGELKTKLDNVRKESLTDALTGIANRKAFDAELATAIAQSRESGEPLCLVMCDIDKFKSVNDNFGHQAGDSVLKEVAQILKGTAREIDRVGRYGGEEFLLILPGTVLDAAVTFAERLREAVDRHTFTYSGGTLTRTISCGVAAAPHPLVKDQEALLRAADDALYVAKETGRNRVVRFDGAEYNTHTESKGTNTSDGEKPVKQAGGSGGSSSALGASSGSRDPAEGRQVQA